ncbi:hypothetical protein [Arachidicoccus soli]|uniref:DUF3592 domain-containing protein n=1 Tax=Arachidicoccus soli TaxID=2341117 RepID=A0A386HLJ9_9BACT|nr:hypothetical protein [Arachidicoccus soli]AYD46778.1 hypothetical protein D6B99_03595 [Arachidicoccus soli]
MYKFLFAFFIVVFGLYLLFSRRPDYFDGKMTTAIIHFERDSAMHTLRPKAFFSLNAKDSFSIDPTYVFRHFKENEKVTVIYEDATPQNAAVYSWWGYWITWKELLACIIGYFILFQAALSIVKNPAPEAMQELEDYRNKPKERKRRYK